MLVVIWSNAPVSLSSLSLGAEILWEQGLHPAPGVRPVHGRPQPGLLSSGPRWTGEHPLVLVDVPACILVW